MHEERKRRRSTRKRKRVFLLQPPQSSHPLGANFTLAAPFFATCAVALAASEAYSKRTTRAAPTKEPFSLQQNIYRIPETKVISETEFPPRALSQPIHESWNKVNCNLLWNSAKHLRKSSGALTMTPPEELRRKSGPKPLAPISKRQQYNVSRLKNEIAFRG